MTENLGLLPFYGMKLVKQKLLIVNRTIHFLKRFTVLTKNYKYVYKIKELMLFDRL